MKNLLEMKIEEANRSDNYYEDTEDTFKLWSGTCNRLSVNLTLRHNVSRQ